MWLNEFRSRLVPNSTRVSQLCYYWRSFIILYISTVVILLLLLIIFDDSFDDSTSVSFMLRMWRIFLKACVIAAEKFGRLRYVEIKHGCICQFAFLDQFVTHNGQHLHGNIDYAGHSFDSFPNGWAAISGPDAIPDAGLAQIVAFVATLELGAMKDMKEPETSLSVTSVTDPSISDRTRLTKRPNCKSVPSNSTMDVPPWWEFSDLWSKLKVCRRQTVFGSYLLRLKLHFVVRAWLTRASDKL